MENQAVIFELVGTVAFAVSGAMVAINKKMDLFGVIILGMTTAVGGGMIRDILIGVTPPAALQDPRYTLVSLATSLVVFLPPVRQRIDTNHTFFILVDAIGLGTFTMIGLEAGKEYHNVFLQLVLAMLTGVGGGVLRDLFAMEKPMIFVHHLYAVASMAGAVVCLALIGWNENIALLSGILTVVILRVLAAKYRWNLPRA